MNHLCMLLFWLEVTAYATSYKILGLFPFPGYNHYRVYGTLMEELAKRGHEVDVLNHFPLNQPPIGYKDLSMNGTMQIFKNMVPMALIENEFSTPTGVKTFMLDIAGIDLCEKTFNTEIVQELKNTKKKYDVIITEIFGNDCMLGFGYYFKVPTISIISSINLPWGNDRIGNPDNPSYIPNYFSSYASSMTLMQRLENTIALLSNKLSYALAERKASIIARKFFGPDMPDLQELAYNTSLLLVNSHYSFNGVRPNVPNFVEVGGLHITPKPLPQNFETILNTSSTGKDKGFIYFSMGSLVLAETFPPEKLMALFDAFGDLPYQVLFKATKENIPKNIKIPSNIHFESWIPQLDTLCHPNVKLFITHGGLLGTQEAVYCGVPCLGIPLFADQILNVKTLVSNGLARMLNYKSLTKKIILSSARELLNNPRYKANANIASRRFRDRPLSALDSAIYWVEYVIRHNGARHLHSNGADLSWYQYYLLDVGIILMSGLLLALFIIYNVLVVVLNVVPGYLYILQKEKSN